MKRLEFSPLLFGFIAGLTAALLIMASNVSAGGILFQVAAAVVIMLAGFSQGNPAAISAVLTAAATSAVLTSPSFALVTALAIFIPAGWASHLANLGRPASELGGPEHLMAWYPLSDILFHLCMLVVVSMIVMGTLAGYGPELVSTIFENLSAQLQASQPNAAIHSDIITQSKNMALLGLPLVSSAMWIFLLFGAYYLAMRIVCASGRNIRPRDHIPSALRMNTSALFAFLASIAACFLGGIPALIGATATGALGAGFLVSGFAMIHHRASGKDWRLPVLIICYLSSLMTLLPAFIIMILGLSETRKTVALTPRKPQNPVQSSHNETEL